MAGNLPASAGILSSSVGFLSSTASLLSSPASLLSCFGGFLERKVVCDGVRWDSFHTRADSFHTRGGFFHRTRGAYHRWLSVTHRTFILRHGSIIVGWPIFHRWGVHHLLVWHAASWRGVYVTRPSCLGGGRAESSILATRASALSPPRADGGLYRRPRRGGLTSAGARHLIQCTATAEN